MATRLYLTTTEKAPAVSVTADASWEITDSVDVGTLEGEKVDFAYATSAAATTSNTPAGAVDVLIARFVSAPLSGSGTIASAIKGQIRASESNSAANARMQAVIRVVSNDGTSDVGTLIGSSAAALSNEFNTSLRNIKIPLGGSTVPTSTGYSDGDRIVVEIGYRKHESATTARSVTFDLGAVIGGTDLPEDETTATQGVPWIEFADNLAFQAVPVRASLVVAQAAITPPTVETRISIVVAQVAISLADAVPGTPSTGRAWGYIID